MYLLGNKVALYTDPQALVTSFIPYLKNQTKSVLAAVTVFVQCDIGTQAGSANRAADALSKAPVSEVLQLEVAEEEPIMRNAQRADKVL